MFSGKAGEQGKDDLITVSSESVRKENTIEEPDRDITGYNRSQIKGTAVQDI